MKMDESHLPHTDTDSLQQQQLEQESPMDLLLEDCVTDIISRTTPRHACHLSLFSKMIRSAADSDVVWERLLPPECQSIISKLSELTLPDLRSKKGLFRHLREHSNLIADGKKQSGKICCMIFSRDLTITWGNIPTNWTWTSPPGARLPEFAELIRVRSLEINGKISTGILSPGTNYTAFLVYKPTEKPYGFENQPVEVSVGLVGTEKQKPYVYLDAVSPSKRDPLGMFHSFVDHRLSQEFPVSWARADYGHHPSLVYRTRRVKRQASLAREDDGHHPKKRGDYWCKVKLGDFYNAGDENGELEMRLEARSGDWMGGLIVQGIEIRPK